MYVYSISFIYSYLVLQDGRNAASLTLAEQYIVAFEKLAKSNNTMILPSNPGDVTGLVAQALAVYNSVSKQGFALPPQSNEQQHLKKNVEYNQLSEEKNAVKINIE